MQNSSDLSAAKRALLERYLSGNQPKQRKTETNAIPRRPASETAPLSLGQQQLWVLAQLIPETPVYNESVSISIPGPLNISALEQAFKELFQRHEAWRTTFPIVDEQAVQKINPSTPFRLLHADVYEYPEADRETEILKLARTLAIEPFDLTQGPLVRALLIRQSEDSYRLLVTLHHIIFDGISIYQVFLPELYALYEAAAHNQPAKLPELPLQYADYAIWQRERLQGKLLEDQLAYWKKQLGDAPALLELPTDRPRPAIPTYRGAVHPLTISPELTDALHAVSRQEGVSPYMLMMAAFKTLLYRYTGQEDISIGTAAAGRPLSQLQTLLGIFINTLVMRTQLTGDLTFRELLQRVREVTLEAHAHQDIPFEYIVKELQPEREQGQNPLFQVLLMLEPPIPVLESGWEMALLDAKTNTSKFDLSLILEEQQAGIRGRIEYSTDLFDEATITRMIEHLQTLLAGIAADPGQRLADLPLLTEQERRQVLFNWNDTATELPQNQSVHQLFEAQSEKTPDATALIFNEQRLSYHELNTRANQLAHQLRKLGIGQESLVGLCLDRSFEMVVGLLGILKAGGAYVPLDPAYPKERLTFMLQDTGASVLITQEKYAQQLPTGDCKVISMNSSEQKHALSQEAQENLPNETTPESLAYVMYTSGSTGRPKGTEIRHISILRLVFGTHFTRLDETRTILHMASISFDAATLEVWGALLHGGRCVLFPEKIPTPTGIGAAVRKHGVTTAWITASLFNAIIDDAPEALQGIEHIMTGGEALSVVHMRRALELLPNTNLTNGYGPTESTTFACCYPIPRQLPSETRSISIGSPIGNTEVYILDKHLQPVPVGVPGELHIGGLGLARGYFKRPELTREKFIQHPFSDDPEARLYKTGDRVRWLPNGTIEFLGRFDQQVKLRGFRIELGEIESVLGQAGGVREALVQARENARHEKFLVAYVIPQAGESTTESQLRKFLKDRLPEFMIPADFILLESLPLTPNGKLDERALPAPQSSHQSKEDSYVAPDQTLHYQLVQIWEDLLNVKPIGIRDNFFALGGHSLLAARLVDRIEQVSGKKIPMATLFAGATIEHLAEVIMGEEQAESLTPVVAVQPKGHKRPFFYLHGDWTGGSFYCLNLARELGPDQPFYILEPYKFAGMAIPPSFEEMAAAHIQMMRSVQPEGPYLLGGFCNGGLVAYEVARQLQNAGEQVDLLVLIDPATPTPHGNVRNRLARIGKLTRSGQDRQLEWWLRIGHMYRYWRLANYRELKDTEYLDSLPPSKAAARKGRLGRAMFKAKSFLSNSKALREYWTAIYEWIAAGYIPGPYRGKITLFWDREDPFRRNDWLGIMQDKEVEEFTIEGSHMSCRAEHLPSLVQHLKACLEMVQAREKEASTV